MSTLGTDVNLSGIVSYKRRLLLTSIVCVFALMANLSTATTIGNTPAVPTLFQTGPTSGSMPSPVDIAEDSPLSFNFDIQIDVAVDFVSDGTTIHHIGFTVTNGQIISNNGLPILSLVGATNLGMPDGLGTLQFSLPSPVNTIHETYSGQGIADSLFIPEQLPLDEIPDYTEAGVSLPAAIYDLTFSTQLGELEGTITGDFEGGVPSAPIATVETQVPMRLMSTRYIDENSPIAFSGTYTASVTSKNTFLSLAGDANGDDSVDLADFSLLAFVFGTEDPVADFNYNGWVDLADFSLLAANFTKRIDTASVLRQPSLHSNNALSLQVDEVPGTRNAVAIHLLAPDTALRAFTFVVDSDPSHIELTSVTERPIFHNSVFLQYRNRVMCASRTAPARVHGPIAQLGFRLANQDTRTRLSLRHIRLLDDRGHILALPDQHVWLGGLPSQNGLLPNYPNPFNPDTWIPFDLAEAASVQIQIFDLAGRLVRTLNSGHLPAGHYRDTAGAIHWDGRTDSGEYASSGVYLARLTAGQFSQMRRMAIRK